MDPLLIYYSFPFIITTLTRASGLGSGPWLSLNEASKILQEIQIKNQNASQNLGPVDEILILSGEVLRKT